MKDSVRGTMKKISSQLKECVPTKKSNQEKGPKTHPVGARALTIACILVMMIEFGERLAYYGTKLMYGPYTKTMLGYGDGQYVRTSNFNDFMTYGSCLFGAYIADAYLGRYKTISYLSPIYLLGMLLLLLSSRFGFDDFPYLGTDGTTYAHAGLWVSISLMAVGGGFIKPCISVFAADQLRGDNDQDPAPETLQALYMWWYFAINIGSFLGQFMSPFLSGTQFVGLHLGEQKSRCLERNDLTPEKYNLCYGTSETSFSEFCKRQGCAGPLRPPEFLKGCCGPLNQEYHIATNFWLGWSVTFGIFALVFFLFYTCGYIIHYKVYPPAGSYFGAFFKTIFGSWKYRHSERKDKYPLSWMTTCKEKIDGVDNSLIDEIRMALHACKIFPFLILFWFVNGQSFVYGYNQCQGPMSTATSWMDCNQIQNFNTIAILLCVPLLDFWIYPFLKKKNVMPSLLSRIAIGMLIESFAFLVLGWYQHIIHERGEFANVKDSTTYSIKPGKESLSIWLQAIPYFLTGFGEVIGNIASMEFAYTNAPSSMKSIVMAINLAMSAMASVLGMAMSGIAGNGGAEIMFWCFGVGLFFQSFFVYYQFKNWQSGRMYFPQLYAGFKEDDLVERGLLSSNSGDESELSVLGDTSD